MRPLLWIGDAVADTGFARCTHRILETVHRNWDVSVLGLNYRGDPHTYPYDIYPTFIADGFGLRRLRDVVGRVRPELIVIQNDPWNVPAYLRALEAFPTVAIMPVDGKNCRGRGVNGIRLGIFWTKFGLQEARLGGFTGPAGIIPLGVDLDIYRPMDKVEARRNIGLPDKFLDAFIVGNVNRNQPRKRLDLSLRYFANWVKTHKVDDAFLFLHVAPTGDTNGIDCEHLASYYGVQNRLIMSDPGVMHGVAESRLAQLYSAFDIQINTCQGEGWGLTTMEGMACGVPQIVPDWSALSEWTEDAVWKVPCTSTAATFDGINVIGGIVDEVQFIEALDLLYRDKSLRLSLRDRAFELVAQPQYRWENIGDLFNQAFEEALKMPVTLPQSKPEVVESAL